MPKPFIQAEQDSDIMDLSFTKMNLLNQRPILVTPFFKSVAIIDPFQIQATIQENKLQQCIPPSSPIRKKLFAVQQPPQILEQLIQIKNIKSVIKTNVLEKSDFLSSKARSANNNTSALPTIPSVKSVKGPIISYKLFPSTSPPIMVPKKQSRMDVKANNVLTRNKSYAES